VGWTKIIIPMKATHAARCREYETHIVKSPERRFRWHSLKHIAVGDSMKDGDFRIHFQVPETFLKLLSRPKILRPK
jgi:hypothetical protein